MITHMSSAAKSTASAAATATSATANAPGGPMGKNQFLKLLIAQMQNQDPMNPMQGDQMAAQLAQFSSLEQLQQINESLSGQAAAQGSLLGAVQSNAAIGTIGHHVVAAGNSLELGGSQGATTVTADLGGAAQSATLKIYDANGKLVGSRELGSAIGGRQTFDIGGAGDGLSGDYTYAIEAKDSTGGAVAVQTYITGRVDGISSGVNGLVLNIGKLTVPYGNVVQVLN
jgi:flagellar basal-body rod modification protein FlgD